MTSERDISKSIKAKLDWWQHLGVVLHFDRLNSGKICINGRWIQMSKAGTPDLVAYIKVKDTVWVYWIEAKSSDGGVWHQTQREFASRFSGVSNCVYEIVSDPKQVDKTIESITGYYDNKFAQMDKEINL
jgi:hypothetical protein